MPRARTISTTDSYFKLIKRFPLRRIKSRTEHAAAVAHLAVLSLKHQRTRDVGFVDYLDMLARLIDEYERGQRMKVDTSGLTPADVIRHLLASNGLSVNGLAKQIGIAQSNLAEMLSGRRDFSKAAIGKLCERFGISPEVFF
jgi:antitoxin component HigA of HigAB toxin-antitoxin module